MNTFVVMAAPVTRILQSIILRQALFRRVGEISAVVVDLDEVPQIYVDRRCACPFRGIEAGKSCPGRTPFEIQAPSAPGTAYSRLEQRKAAIRSRCRCRDCSGKSTRVFSVKYYTPFKLAICQQNYLETRVTI